MGNGQILVNTAALESSSQKIVQYAHALDTTLDNLSKRLEALKEQWVGNDNEAYDEARHKWAVATKGLNKTLNDIGAMVGKAKQNYVETETYAASLFKH